MGKEEATQNGAVDRKTSCYNGVPTNKHYNVSYGNSASCPGTFAFGRISCTQTEHNNWNVSKGKTLNQENANFPGDQISSCGLGLVLRAKNTCIFLCT